VRFTQREQERPWLSLIRKNIRLRHDGVSWTRDAVTGELKSAAKADRQMSGNPEIRTNSEACLSTLLDAGDLPHSLP
jgi:hypothetical protein